ncbi:hypothetical protein EDB81DRAFT_369466 [Dactylonectria macrodidyma]|uniref:Uncharacterized protein n=1 Tax=Dactylonectria macrodidyma TaxID=307937 RepID=A0A9P9D1J0_9HYPO|nr:hypothetical protein EDB81DRAFT_369466 [Dactylonectria macrodidyma]
MDFGLNPEELSNDVLFVVCARCGEERPESAFTAKRQSAGQTKQCIDCRNQRVSHVSSTFLVYKTLNPHQMKHSRSKVVLQTLRNIALRPSSPGSSVANNINNTILAIWTPSQYYCIVKGCILYYPI